MTSVVGRLLPETSDRYPPAPSMRASDGTARVGEVPWCSDCHARTHVTLRSRRSATIPSCATEPGRTPESRERARHEISNSNINSGDAGRGGTRGGDVPSPIRPNRARAGSKRSERNKQGNLPPPAALHRFPSFRPATSAGLTRPIRHWDAAPQQATRRTTARRQSWRTRIQTTIRWMT